MPENKSVMKKLILIVIIAAAAGGYFTINYFYNKKQASYVSQSTDKNIIEIKEKMFIAQTNDVYLNAEDYFGKTIRLEGMFKQDEDNSKPYYFVIRYGPGCCGYDGNAGFEVAWANEKSYPVVDSWVEATGVLKYYEENTMKYLYLDLISLNVLEKRGAEMVYQ